MTPTCTKRIEGNQWVCNRCELVWDLDDQDPPVCQVTIPPDRKAMSDIRRILSDERD